MSEKSLNVAAVLAGQTAAIAVLFEVAFDAGIAPREEVCRRLHLLKEAIRATDADPACSAGILHLLAILEERQLHEIPSDFGLH